MIKTKKLLLLSAVLFLLTNCAYHGGYMTQSAALSTNNFAYVKWTIQGTSKAYYIFGIGGLKPNALVDQVRQDMITNNPLKDNQAYVNVTVNWKRTFVIPFYMEHKCTVTASIVQLNPS